MDFSSALSNIAFIVFISIFLFIVASAVIDSRKKRVVSGKPFISFIMPTHNDSASLENSIKSIFDSCKHEFELIVVNDKSPDNTLEILAKLSRTYRFRVLNNKENLGKSRSINAAFKHTKGDIIFMIDSDIMLNERAVNDVLSRLSHEKVGGVSCRYTPINKGFFSKLQEIEYGMISMIQLSNNLVTTTGFWGGCLAVKREVFQKVGLLSENCICEDADLALKIGRAGWKAQESSAPIHTYVPENFAEWYNQKIRWSAGTMQALINHFKVYLKNPVALMFFAAYGLMTISFMLAFSNNLLYYENFFALFSTLHDVGYSFLSSVSMAKVAYGYQFAKMFVMFVGFPLFSIPYIAYNQPIMKKPLAMLWVFPFSMIYMPIFTAVNVWGLIVGIFRTIKLKKGGRGW